MLSFKILNKTWIVAALLLMLAQNAGADDIQSIVFGHGELKVDHLRVLRGTLVNLKNEHQDAVYNISLIHASSGKSVVSVEKISGGSSVQMEFSTEGSYRLHYSTQPDSAQISDRYVLIDVVAAHPA